MVPKIWCVEKMYNFLGEPVPYIKSVWWWFEETGALTRVKNYVRKHTTTTIGSMQVKSLYRRPVCQTVSLVFRFSWNPFLMYGDKAATWSHLLCPCLKPAWSSIFSTSGEILCSTTRPLQQLVANTQQRNRSIAWASNGLMSFINNTIDMPCLSTNRLNLFLFIQPRWNAITYFCNHYNVLVKWSGIHHPVQIK